MQAFRTGWYGKLPAAGDFISKHLPDGFVRPWDDWLQAGMVQARSRDPDSWQEHFLTFPVWRFVLGAGVVSTQAWTGLLMPSADRVGRLFPFTIVRPLEGPGIRLDLLEQQLDQLTALAMRLLDSDSLDSFENDMQAFDDSEPAPQAADGGRLFDLELQAASLPIRPGAGLGDTLATLALQELLLRGRAGSLWWLPAQPGIDGIVRASPSGLNPSLFEDLVC